MIVVNSQWSKRLVGTQEAPVQNPLYSIFYTFYKKSIVLVSTLGYVHSALSSFSGNDC